MVFNSYYGKLREKNTQAQSLSPLDFPILHPPPSDEAKAEAGSSAEPRAAPAAEPHPATADTPVQVHTTLPCENHG